MPSLLHHSWPSIFSSQIWPPAASRRIKSASRLLRRGTGENEWTTRLPGPLEPREKWMPFRAALRQQKRRCRRKRASWTGAGGRVLHSATLISLGLLLNLVVHSGGCGTACVPSRGHVPQVFVSFAPGSKCTISITKVPPKLFWWKYLRERSTSARYSKPSFCRTGTEVFMCSIVGRKPSNHFNGQDCSLKSVLTRL